MNKSEILIMRLDAELKGFRATVDQINNPRR